MENSTDEIEKYELLIKNCSKYLVSTVEKEIKDECSLKLVKNFTKSFPPGISKMFNNQNSFFMHEIQLFSSNDSF